MSIELGTCDVCGAEPAVGVGAVPGAPMSLAYGRECLRRHTQPLWLVEFHTEDAPEGVNPAEHLAWWFLEETVYLDSEAAERYGKSMGYCTVRDLFPEVPRWRQIVQRWNHHKNMAALRAASEGA